MSRDRRDLSTEEQGGERRMGSETPGPGGFGRGRASYEEGPGGQGPVRGGAGLPSTLGGEEPQPTGVVPVGGEDAEVVQPGQTGGAGPSGGGETGTGSGSTSGEGQ